MERFNLDLLTLLTSYISQEHETVDFYKKGPGSLSNMNFHPKSYSGIGFLFESPLPTAHFLQHPPIVSIRNFLVGIQNWQFLKKIQDRF